MEGCWLAHYDAGSAHGEGIIILRRGELIGGDLEHFWSGTCDEEPPKIYARIRVVPFVSTQEESSMARERPIILSLSGFCTDEWATLDGHPEDRGDRRVHIEMHRCRSVRSQELPLAA